MNATATEERPADTSRFDPASGVIPMAPPPGEQLTMTLGGEAIGKHVYGSIKIKGAMKVKENLDLGDEVRVQVIDSQGEVIASGGAVFDVPTFKSQKDEGIVVGIERIHTAELY